MIINTNYWFVGSDGGYSPPNPSVFSGIRFSILRDSEVVQELIL